MLLLPLVNYLRDLVARVRSGPLEGEEEEIEEEEEEDEVEEDDDYEL